MHAPALSYRLSRNWAYLILLLALSLALALGVAAQQRVAPLRQLDHLFFDTLAKYSASAKSAQRTVVIDIDDSSLSAVGQWPWPRYKVAAVVRAVADAQPAAIGLDIVFPESDRTSLNNIKKNFREDFGLDVQISGAPSELSDNDGHLGQVLAQTGTVGAKYFYFDHSSRTAVSRRPQFLITGRTDLLVLPEATGVLTNTYRIDSQLEFSGFLNAQPNDDGIFRGLPLLIRHNGVIYPHLALATFMRSAGVTSASIVQDWSGPLIRAGNRDIPVDQRGVALLSYHGTPELYPAISAVDILNRTFRSDAIKGKTALIGSSGVGMHDLHSTIHDSQFPGLKTQAAMVENMLNNNFIREPVWEASAILGAVIATALLIAALFIFVRATLPLLLGCAAMAVATLLLCSLAFLSAGLLVSPVAPVLLCAILFTLFTVTRFSVEKRHSYLWFKKLVNAQQVAIESMSAVAETRDGQTAAHCRRVQHYTRAIAERLRDSGHYADTLTQEYIDLLFTSAPLHDIGKVGVSDHILLKPGKLTPEEYSLMQKHAEFGRKMICSTAEKIEGDNYLRIAGEVAATHHEKWDGTGYPHGLAGHAIPLSGRILIVADVYDAIISQRCYKAAFSHETAIQDMRAGRATFFDPVILDAFLGMEEQIREIAADYVDRFGQKD